MKHKKIIALLAAAAIMGTLAGCKAGNKPGQDPSIPFDGQQPSFETQAPVESNATQAVGKVTAIDGTKITIENDDDDTPDTIEEIKTGDVVVIEVGKDGKVTSLTVKSLSSGFRNRDGSDGNGKSKKSRDGNGKRKDRGNGKNGNGDSGDADSED